MSPDKEQIIVTTSWDDGHPLDLRIADMLAKYGVRGTFYVPMRNARPTLTSRQIRDLSSCFEIGAHTVNHVVLTQCSQNQAWREICDSKTTIEDITGQSCPVFCFPRGRYHNRHLRMAATAGFSAVRTVELFSLSLPYRLRGISVIPTTLQAVPQSRYTHVRNAIKRTRGQAILNILRFGHGTDWVKTAMSLIEYMRTSGGVFHLWGHSWEIEELGQWAQFESVLQMLFECKHLSVHFTNSELCALS